MEMTGTKHKPKPYVSAKWRRILACVVLFFLFSFLGWCWEKFYFYLVYGINADRGFLTLPFCTVYGSALLLIRAALKLPDPERTYPRNMFGFVFYCVAASLIATAVELSTGLFFEQVFGVSLWTYRGFSHVYQDYVCLSVSVAWGALIGIFMAGVWAPLERHLSKIRPTVLFWVGGVLTLCVAFDFFLTAFL